MYELNFMYYPSFVKTIKKINDKNKGNKQYNDGINDMKDQLKKNPRDTSKMKIHPLTGKFKGFWSIWTGVNADRCIYSIDDELKPVYLYDIGDHSIYESYEERLTLRMILGL